MTRRCYLSTCVAEALSVVPLRAVVVHVNSKCCHQLRRRRAHLLPGSAREMAIYIEGLVLLGRWPTHTHTTPDNRKLAGQGLCAMLFLGRTLPGSTREMVIYK